MNQVKGRRIVRILLRVSSNQQLEADGDLGVQRDIIKDYISKHDEWILDTKEYFEGSNSGYKNAVIDRDVLQEALQDAINHEYDILAVYKDDRIGRRMWEIGSYVMQLKKYNVDIYTVKDGCISPDDDDIMGQMMLALRYGNAQKSSADTGMRVKDTAQKMVQKGKFMGGKAPYGYELAFSGEISKHGRALKKLQIIDKQADVVKQIYELSLSKEYGSAKIAKTLNSDNYYAQLAPNDYWKGGTITSILTNPIYAGYVAYKRRERINGQYLKLQDDDWIKSEEKNEDIAIVDERVWNEVQKKRKMRSKKYQKKFSDNEYNLIKKNDGFLPLIDVAYCGYCGGKLTNGTRYNYWVIKDTGEKRSSKVGYYKCQNAWQGVPHNVTRGFAAETIEDIVFKEVSQYLDNLLKDIDLHKNIENIENIEYNKLKKELEQYEKKLYKEKDGIALMEEHLPEAMVGDYALSVEDLAHAIKLHKNNKKDIEDAITAIQEKIDSIKSTRDSISEIEENVPKWKEIFFGSDKHTKRVIINKIVDKIYIKKDEIHIIYKLNIPTK